MEKLKPCPFCGSDDMRVAVLYGTNFVECRKCGSSGSRMRMRMDAIKAWNTRAERTCNVESRVVEDDTGALGYFCSACGAEYDPQEWSEMFKYCPNCGAKVIDDE